MESEPKLNPEYSEDFFDSLMLNEMKKAEEDSMEVESEDLIFIKESYTEAKSPIENTAQEIDNESMQSSNETEQQETLNKNQKSKHLRKPLSTFAIPRPPHLETIKRPIYDRKKFVSKPIRIAKRRADDDPQPSPKILKALPDLVPVETFKKMKLLAQKVANNQYLPQVYHTFCGEPTASTSRENPTPPPVMAYTTKYNPDTFSYFAQPEPTNQIPFGIDPLGTDLLEIVHAGTVEKNTMVEVDQCDLDGIHTWNTTLDELDKTYLGCRPSLSNEDESPSFSPLRCDVCFNQFLSQAGFDKHLERTVADMQINCWVCGLCLSFPNFCLLKRHILFHESDGFLMKGPLNVIVKTAAVLKDKDKSSNGKSKCTECNGFFDSLVEHLTEVVRPLDLDLKCRVCPYIPPSICGMRMHIRLHINKAPYSCPDCGRSFPTRRECIEHSANTCCHFDKSLRYRCSYCEVLFYDRLLFKNHLMSAHNTLIYRCGTCNYSCNSVKTVTEHAVRNHPTSNVVNPLFHVCQICSNVLIPRGKYSGHILDHMNEPASIRYIYLCKKCGMVTVNRAQFMNHKSGSKCQIIFSLQPIKANSTSQTGSSITATPKITGGSMSNPGHRLRGKTSEKKNINSYIYKCLLCGLIVDHVWTEVIKHCRGYHRIQDTKKLHDYIVETTFAEQKEVIDSKNKRGVNIVNGPYSKNILKLAKMQKLTQKKVQKQKSLQVTCKPNVGRSTQTGTQGNLPVNPKVLSSQQNEIHENVSKAGMSLQSHIQETVPKHLKPCTSQQNEIKQMKTLRKRIYLKAGVTQKIEIREQMNNPQNAKLIGMVKNQQKLSGMVKNQQKHKLIGMIKNQQKLTGMVKNQQKLTGMIKHQKKQVPTGMVKTQQKEKLTGMVNNQQKEKLTGLVDNKQKEKITAVVKNQQIEKLTGIVENKQKEILTGMVKNQQKEKLTGIVKTQQKEKLTGMVEKQKEKLTRMVKNQQKHTEMDENQQKEKRTGMVKNQQKGKLIGMVKNQQKEKLTGMVKKQQKEKLTGMVEKQRKEKHSGVVKNRQKEKLTGMVENQQKEKLIGMVKNQQKEEFSGMVEKQQKEKLPGMVEKQEKEKVTGINENQEKEIVIGMVGNQQKEELTGMIKNQQKEKRTGMVENQEKSHAMDKNQEKCHSIDKNKPKNRRMDKNKQNCHATDKNKQKCHAMDKKQQKRQVISKTQSKERLQEINKNRQKERSLVKRIRQNETTQGVHKNQQKERSQGIGKNQQKESSPKIEKSQQEGSCQKIEMSQQKESSQKIEKRQQEENCQEDEKHLQETDKRQQKEKNQEVEKGKQETDKNQDTEGAHKCNKCSFSTNVMNEYREHIIIHRKDPDLYQCLECAACFVVRPSLEKHLIGIHGIDAVDDYIKNHNVCHSLTQRSKALLPGQCSVCFEIFDSPNSLYKHFRSHGMAFLNQIKQV